MMGLNEYMGVVAISVMWPDQVVSSLANLS